MYIFTQITTFDNLNLKQVMTIKKTLLLAAIAGIGLASCQSKSTETVVTPTEVDTSGVISYETAKKYVFNYKRRAGTVDSIKADGTHVPLPNSRAVFFTKEKLQAMLATIEKEHGDGARFYFASYNPRLGTDKGAGIYDGYNTLVMISTVKKDTLGQKGLHWDSYTKPVGNGTGTGIIIGAGTGGDPVNRGEMCPPPHNCPSVGATLIE